MDVYLAQSIELDGIVETYAVFSNAETAREIAEGQAPHTWQVTRFPLDDPGADSETIAWVARDGSVKLAQ